MRYIHVGGMMITFYSLSVVLRTACFGIPRSPHLVFVYLQVRSQNFKKRILLSSCPSVRPTCAWNNSAPLGGF